MDPVIEYVFGTGDGDPTAWHSPADADPDADGIAEAVRLDFDGDGRIDDLMWDTDGDGIADVAALDTDDDGEPDAFYRDRGTGIWGIAVGRPAETGGSATPAPHTRTDPPTGTDAPAEPGPPGATRVQTHDLDGDGSPDIEIVDVAPSAGELGGRRLYVDEDGDGDPDRVLIDTDADGVADTTYDASAPGFGR
ncbi:hypothetical protein [Gordonia desulfuricans]|nr:hypothetical protein [Gordonia desulfuricans]